MLASKPVAPPLLTSRYEVEVFGRGPETKESLHKWEACTKNPGHANFIPAPRFSLENLPHLFQEERFLTAVKYLCNLTVRIRVGKTFTPREESQIGGPQTGSGRIVDISRSESPCSCTGCRLGGINSGVCWNVDVATALHVADNTEEAKLTRVDLFYDDLDSFSNGTAKTVWGTKVLYRDICSDTCVFRCALHDENLQKALSLEQSLLEALHILPKFIDNNVVVVVSHPHGRPKQVTIGEITRQLVSRAKSKNDQPAYLNFETYTKRYFPCQVSNIIHNAGTCPGSSGAPVLWLGYSFGLLGYRRMWTRIKYYLMFLLLFVLVANIIYRRDRPGWYNFEELHNMLLIVTSSLPLSLGVVFCWRKIRKLLKYPPVMNFISTQYVKWKKGNPFQIIQAHCIGYISGLCYFDFELALLFVPVRTLLYFLTPVFYTSVAIQFVFLFICVVNLHHMPATTKLFDTIWSSVNHCVPYLLLVILLEFMKESATCFTFGCIMAFLSGIKLWNLFREMLPMHQITFEGDKVSEIEVNPIAVHTGVSLSGCGNEGYCYMPVIYNCSSFSKRVTPRHQELTRTLLRQRRYHRVRDKLKTRNNLLMQQKLQIFHTRTGDNDRLDFISCSADSISNDEVFLKID